jgi:hypothetical protein
MSAFPTIPVSKHVVAILLCTVLIMGLVGCGWTYKASVAHDVLATPPQRFSDRIVMQKQADDRREDPGRVGHWNATLFAIEIGSVQTDNPVGNEIPLQVKEALESVGYQISLTEAPYASPLPTNILKVQINEFYFKNYSWFAPLFFTWGSITLTLIVENSEGKALFSKTFQHKGNSYRPFEGGFDVAIKEALTEILNQIVSVSCIEEFRQALKA